MSNRINRILAIAIGFAVAGCATNRARVADPKGPPATSTAAGEFFEHDAQIETPCGARAIRQLRAGDVIWAVDPLTGARVAATISARLDLGPGESLEQWRRVVATQAPSPARRAYPVRVDETMTDNEQRGGQIGPSGCPGTRDLDNNPS